MIHFRSGKVLIPVDFSETSLLAIKHGAFLAQITKGDLYLIHVISKHYERYTIVDEPVHMDNPTKLETIVNTKLNEVANDIRKSYGINANVIVSYGNATREIIKASKENNIDIIVMGTHGYSPLEELVIGSNALKVLTKGACPVMTMSEKANKFGYNSILLPIDTSPHSRQKVIYAMELAKIFSAHVHCVGILGEDETDELGPMEIIMTQVKGVAKEKGAVCSTEILTNVKNRAVATVNYGEKKNADLIVIMTDQDAELSGFFLGPYSQQVIHLSKVPVIAVKPEDHPDDVNFTLLSGTSGI
jgi:nucleotide-binding universal stress UspA family protein